MTEFADTAEMQICYDKFIALRKRQSIANKKYRATDYGKKKTNEMHRLWCNKRKDDLEYQKHLNLKARERYHTKKAKQLESAVGLGENEIKEK